MQAIRNESTQMVTFLLNLGVIVNDFSFLGMSILSLACAISGDMFELIYKSCPSALEYAAHDDINPLCVAALKNDKELFFKLIHLNLDLHRANAFTHTMIKQSTEPEIVAVAKSHLNSEDYWNDLSDIEDLLKDEESTSNSINKTDIKSIYYNDNLKTTTCITKFCVEISPSAMTKHISNKNLYLNLQPSKLTYISKNPLSPDLSYFNGDILPISPNTFVLEDGKNNTFTRLTLNVNEKINTTENYINKSSLIKIQDPVSPLVLRSFKPQFSPTKSPNLPHDMSEDNIFDETTPTPPKYKTPPRGIMLDPSTTRLIVLLQQFGLKRHIPLFVEQEVDLDLFLSLNDKDLIEIGIDCKIERLILLSVIKECKGSET
ncbi:PREDICTED: uncharacterized protein LOC105365777 isoform X1 [Ceratosolen solmsi marchali]|uniref:Uncharacterized protein LOC105365777 isoform X1 n=1 Tax=Ceratosolen solmsi marchali TaxID=326594 RepID=A0AAJ6YQF3_9HYME|nr:PREDICTED: uncharacterized protein LOC105365777 isoform X1 [Ceratosolen solmsi marchali]